MRVQNANPLTRAECLQIAASYQCDAALCYRRARMFAAQGSPHSVYLARTEQRAAAAYAASARLWRDYYAPVPLA